MASSRNARKKSVDMAAPVARVSRIRRDPPPAARMVSAAEVKDRETLALVVGVAAIALALFAILIGIGNANWSPSQYTIRIHESS